MENNICAVIDAQGFTSNGIFYPRELAIVSDNLNDCVQIDTKLDYASMSQKDKRTNMYLEHYLLGMPLRPYRALLGLKTAEVYSTIENWYEMVATDKSSILGVKNYQLEEIVKSINIPYFSLFECPKGEKLDNKYGPIWFCAYHTHLPKNNNKARCSRRKATYIWKWLNSGKTVEFETGSKHF